MSANHYARYLGTLVPTSDGGGVSPEFERHGADFVATWSTRVSAQGMRRLKHDAALYEEMRPTFNAIEDRLGECEHGEPIADLIEQGTLTWSINDYVCEPVHGHPLWMLYGMHEDGEWCFARNYFRGVVSHFGSTWESPLLDMGQYPVVPLEAGVLL